MLIKITMWSTPTANPCTLKFYGKRNIWKEYSNKKVLGMSIKFSTSCRPEWRADENNGFQWWPRVASEKAHLSNLDLSSHSWSIIHFSAGDPYAQYVPSNSCLIQLSTLESILDYFVEKSDVFVQTNYSCCLSWRNNLLTKEPPMRPTDTFLVVFL